LAVINDAHGPAVRCRGANITRGNIACMQRYFFPEVIEVPPLVSQELELECGSCKHRGTYDVGTIFLPDPESKTPPENLGFKNYFRCVSCGSAGPWEVCDFSKVQEIARHRHEPGYANRIFIGAMGLQEGTVWQTMAMAEDHLLEELKGQPDSFYLLAHLGNLMRNCGQIKRAIPYYEKALLFNPWELESRFYLFSFALQDNNLFVAAAHAGLLVGTFFDGYEARTEPITEALAFSTVKKLRMSPQGVRQRLLQALHEPEDVGMALDFFKKLFKAEGPEVKILEHFTECLLEMAILPFDPSEAAADDKVDREATLDPCPPLKALVEAKGLHEKLLSVVPPETKESLNQERSNIKVSDGTATVEWKVPSLRELFRGEQKPIPDLRPDDFPLAYVFFVLSLEQYILVYGDRFGDPTDQELEETFSSLRRRPDGRSLDPLHLWLWQATALLLGNYRISATEHEFLMAGMERTARHGAERPVSRNYMALLREARVQ
jgi:tetratricopeptide (TPR) repeat protein